MGRNQPKPQTVDEAKQRLRAPGRQTDYLAPIRKHPIASVGAALAVGMLAHKGKLPPSLISVGLQLLKKL